MVDDQDTRVCHAVVLFGEHPAFAFVTVPLEGDKVLVDICRDVGFGEDLSFKSLTWTTPCGEHVEEDGELFGFGGRECLLKVEGGPLDMGICFGFGTGRWHRGEEWL